METVIHSGGVAKATLVDTVGGNKLDVSLRVTGNMAHLEIYDTFIGVSLDLFDGKLRALVYMNGDDEPKHIITIANDFEELVGMIQEAQGE